MPTATLTTKGQVTLPKEVRKRLGVDRGDQIEFVFERDGSIRLRPLGRSVRELAGLLHRPGLEAATPTEMSESIVELLAADDERIRNRA